MNAEFLILYVYLLPMFEYHPSIDIVSISFLYDRLYQGMS